MAHGSAEEQSAAFDAFYRRHTPYFYAICHDVVNRYKVGVCEVDDLFQATMLKALQRASTFKMEKFTAKPEDMEHAADAWLGAIAENLLKDWLSARPLCVPLDPESLAEDGGCPAADDQPYGEDSEDAVLVRQAIETLSPNEQKVIWVTSLFYKRSEHQRTPSKDLDKIVQSLQTSRANFRKIRERALNKIRSYIRNSKPLPPPHEPPGQIRIV